MPLVQPVALDPLGLLVALAGALLLVGLAAYQLGWRERGLADAADAEQQRQLREDG